MRTSVVDHMVRTRGVPETIRCKYPILACFSGVDMCALTEGGLNSHPQELEVG
jgi:hypothetical protein